MDVAHVFVTAKKGQLVTVPVSVQWPIVDASLREQRTRQVYIHYSAAFQNYTVLIVFKGPDTLSTLETVKTVEQEKYQNCSVFFLISF